MVECLRRVALAGLSVFIYRDTAAQIAIMLLLAIIFMIVSEILSPFALSVEMWLYRAGHYVIFASMYLALLLRVDVSDESDQSQEVFSGVVVVAHGAMLLVVIAQGVMIFFGWSEVVEAPNMLKGVVEIDASSSSSPTGVDSFPSQIPPPSRDSNCVPTLSQTGAVGNVSSWPAKSPRRRSRLDTRTYISGGTPRSASWDPATSSTERTAATNASIIWRREGSEDRRGIRVTHDAAKRKIVRGSSSWDTANRPYPPVAGVNDDDGERSRSLRPYAIGIRTGKPRSTFFSKLSDGSGSQSSTTDKGTRNAVLTERVRKASPAYSGMSPGFLTARSFTSSAVGPKLAATPKAEKVGSCFVLFWEIVRVVFSLSLSAHV